MRGRMSFIGAIVRGLFLFVVMTASLAVALFIAITGPPSNDEMRGVRVVADHALHQFESGVGRLSANVCAQLPPKARAAAGCADDGPPVTQAKAEPPRALPPPSDTAVPQPPVPSRQARTPEDDTRLFGANDAATVPVVLEPVRVSAAVPRHAHGRAARASRLASRRPAQRISSRAHPRSPVVAPHRPTPVRAPSAHTPPHEAPAHPTPVVATPPQPSPAQVVRDLPHPQRAAPEPQIAAAPPSAAPVDETAPEDAPQDGSADPPPEKDPAQAQMF